jgi:hypothetical protein
MQWMTSTWMMEMRRYRCIPSSCCCFFFCLSLSVICHCFVTDIELSVFFVISSFFFFFFNAFFFQIQTFNVHTYTHIYKPTYIVCQLFFKSLRRRASEEDKGPSRKKELRSAKTRRSKSLSVQEVVRRWSCTLLVWTNSN